MIYDCFPFNYSTEMLELHLRAHNDYVDRFIIVDSDMMVTGEKTIHHTNHIPVSFFNDFKDKIEIIKISPINTGKIDSNIDYRYNAVYNSLSNAHPEDIIVLGEMENILNCDAFEFIIKSKKPGFFALDTCYLFFNYILPKKITTSSVFFRRKHLNKHTPAEIMNKEACCDMGRLLHSGWSCSSKLHNGKSYNSYSATMFTGPDIVETNKNFSHLKVIAPGLGQHGREAFSSPDKFLEDLIPQVVFGVEIFKGESLLKSHITDGQSFIFVPQLSGVNRLMDLIFLNNTLDDIEHYVGFVRRGGVVCGNKYHPQLDQIFTKCNRYKQFWFALL